MHNTVQPYAWGSRTALTELYGIPNPDNRPMAELWMGAHPRASSVVDLDSGGASLDDHILANPEQVLGAGVAQAFGPRLPFLLKVLCAAEPLSIQAHPSLEQARAGFKGEEQNGPPLDAPERNYRDANHKPELICAVRPFWGLRGFRPVAEIQAEFAVPQLRTPDVPFHPPRSEGDLSEFFASLLRLPADVRRELIAGALSVASERYPDYHSVAAPGLDDPRARYYWVQRIADVHPGDIGIVSPLLLNTFCLAPGQAVYQPAGVLHAYLSGVGIELMANSDNVLRGGMTVKHIDVEELLAVGVFQSQATELVEPQPSPLVSAGDSPADSPADSVRASVYPTPFREFELHVVDLSGSSAQVESGSPTIILCHRGLITVDGDGRVVSLAAGQTAFVQANASPVTVSGEGTLYIATVPR